MALFRLANVTTRPALALFHPVPAAGPCLGGAPPSHPGPFSTAVQPLGDPAAPPHGPCLHTRPLAPGGPAPGFLLATNLYIFPRYLEITAVSWPRNTCLEDRQCEQPGSEGRALETRVSGGQDSRTVYREEEADGQLRRFRDSSVSNAFACMKSEILE
ncbi:hypothetical protein P7K49_029981 [Saguinus oedipus]|uniref:Uncharacterized protein n=1 Tax=Saguinus oedipus TaxID=9490 RepID=A0ABQ9U8R0_SAGOE|nr:hypothetical protein P7K49_029981 [Saguinus oedipus]